MTVYCMTDEMAERQLQRLGPYAPLLIRALQNRNRASTQLLGRLPGQTTHTWPFTAKERAPEGVDFRPDAEPRFTLNLGVAGAERIRGEVGWGAGEGLEVGGYLWAHQRAKYRGVVACHVSTGGTRNGPRSVVLGDPRDVAAAMPDWLARNGLVVVGDYHLHPISDGTPSRGDLEGWARSCRSNGSFRWAGLILWREEGRHWSEPRFTAWVTSSDGRGGYIVEPAKVVHP
jgi:proteasome lid subunit RPN8/RPN11